MVFILCALLIALAFEYVNGFHDTANSIATTVSTKVLTPRQAVMLAAIFNLMGALVGTSVATTIGKGLVDTHYVTVQTIFIALLAALAWNIFTWWLGLPSSSSHALIGALCGATLASAHGKWSVIRWDVLNTTTGKMEGLWPKVVMPMFVSPVVGIIAGCLIMALLQVLVQRMKPRIVNLVFGKLQLVSAAAMGFSHGTNDAQKTMGIIALILFTATKDGTFENLPQWLQFLQTPNFTVATWVKIVCAIVMALGTAAGGWRIIRTMGHKMVRLQPLHGFAAETTAASIIQFGSHLGIPLSTTHIIATSIMGVGATKRLSAVKWGIVGKIIWAWVLTLPITACTAYWAERIALMFLDPAP
ncbi:MAG: inorganic phosphate transporter [Verrucomicrobia bacterium]|nr:inorganic phosphate transporter [Verrucomicrobiota bacterium]